LAAGRAGAAQLYGNLDGGHITHRQRMRRASTTEREPAAVRGPQGDCLVDSDVREIRWTGEDVLPAGQLKPRSVGFHCHRALQWQHDHLVVSGVESMGAGRNQRDDPQ
jgi:hypothetical protein